jgi:uncharacterized membrane protein YcaP (DUF421 family)
MFFLTKLMGYRQMSQLSMFDYINGITIGSIAAEMAVSPKDDFLKPLVAMIVYGVATVLLSMLTSKSMMARRLIIGKPVVLLNNGEIYEKNLKKAKIDVNEFLEQCRVSGYFDVSKLQTAVLEGNGKISFLPKVSDRPLNPNDMGLEPVQEMMVANVIIDGQIMEENLKHTGKDRNWLNAQLKGQGCSDEKEVLLGTCDMEGTFTAFLKNGEIGDEDVLM